MAKLNTKKFKVEHTKFDNRIKIQPEQLKEVHKMFNAGVKTKDIAAHFKVSYMAIWYLVNPEKLHKNRLRLKERGGSKIYYDKKVHGERMKKSYHHKKDVIQKIKDNEKDTNKTD